MAFNPTVNATRLQGQADVLGSIYGQSGSMANALASAYGSQAAAQASAAGAGANAASNMASSAANAYTQMFGAYGQNAGRYMDAVAGLSNNALTQAGNMELGRYSAYAQGQNAYQNMLGSMGTAALAGYGNAANAAMQAQAMNSTAAMRAMADAMAQNQQAMAGYGASQQQALAALAASYANAGTGFANARAANAGNAAQLGIGGATAYGNLGSSLGSAAGNLASVASQSEAAMRSSANQAFGGISAAEAAALAQANSAAAQSQASMAPSFAAAAGNDLNYTRDMAKLGLARELGLAGLNAFGGSAPSSGGVSIYGPDGLIASGSSGQSPGASASLPYYGGQPSGGQPWYANMQPGSGAGLAGLTSQADRIERQAAAGADGIMGSAAASRGSVADSTMLGTAANQYALGSGLDAISREGDVSRGGISDSLLMGFDAVNDGSQGITSDAMATFGNLGNVHGSLTDRGVLDALMQSNAAGLGMLQSAFDRGQRDPREIYDSALSGITGLLNPLLQEGRSSMDRFYGMFPPSGTGIDTTPYVQQLQDAYVPYMMSLNEAFRSQNDLISNATQAGRGFSVPGGGGGVSADGVMGQIGGMFGDLMNHANRFYGIT